jgi:hypothetical protein
MATTTTNMGLKAWDLGTDPYSHSDLAGNFAAIDVHDHTSGKGKQIPTGGIADSAITSAKIADGTIVTADLANNSVTSAKIVDGTITSADIADGTITGADIAPGTITADKLAPNALLVGQVMYWYRVDASVTLPSGYEVLDGRAWSSVTNTLGPGGTNWTTGNMPNLLNKFILGAALSGTGSGTGTPPAIGGTGGSHTASLAHTHTVASHTHTGPSHTHTGPSHSHTFASGGVIHSRQTDTTYVAVPTGFDNLIQTSYIAGFNSGAGDAAAPMDAAGTGSTGAAGTGATGAAAPATDSQLSATTDIRPAHVGLLPVMRVI